MHRMLKDDSESRTRRGPEICETVRKVELPMNVIKGKRSSVSGDGAANPLTRPNRAFALRKQLNSAAGPEAIRGQDVMASKKTPGHIIKLHLVIPVIYF